MRSHIKVTNEHANVRIVRSNLENSFCSHVRALRGKEVGSLEEMRTLIDRLIILLRCVCICVCICG